MAHRVKIFVGLAVLVLAVGTTVWYLRGRAGPEPGVIRLSGNIEVIDAEVSFKIAGRVEERPVDEGEPVAAGQLIALLDTAELASEVAMRQAERDAAAARLAELEAGSRPEEIAEAAAALARAAAALTELEAGSRPQEIAVAEAAVARARAELADAQTNYQRVAELYRAQMAAQQEHDSARARYDAAQARLQEAAEQLKLIQEGPRQEAILQARAAQDQAQERLNLVQQGPRREEIERARAELARAEAGLTLARTRLEYGRLTAPFSALVLSKNIEPGEYVAPGTPVVTIGDLANVWLRAYLDERDLGRVKLGQPVRVRTDTYPDKVYEGRLAFISAQAEFTPKSVQTPRERVKLVYRVKIDIPNPEMELKPGMPADAEISTSHGG